MKLLMKELNDGTTLFLQFIPGCEYYPTEYLFLGIKLPDGTRILKNHVINEDLEFFYEGTQCFDVE